MKQTIIVMLMCTASIAGVSSYICYKWGQIDERTNGQAAQERAAAIDACAREAWVYPEGCEMRAVVVTPREEPAPDKAAALLPPPVGSV